MAGGNAELREKVAALEALVGTIDGDQFLTILTRLAYLEAEMNRLSEECTDLKTENGLLRRAVGNEEAQRGADRTKVRIPEPKEFNGTRSAKKLENFLWDMEQYFHAAKVQDEDKVPITTMYLVDDAKLWWRTRVADDVSAGRPKIDSWEGLKKELKDQFFPSNAGWIARDRLKKLKQTGTVRDYVKDFSSLMLDISNMSEEDKLHNFLYGLQSWAQMELRRQNVKDLPSAIATADALGDFRLGQDGSDFSTTLKSKNGNKDKGKEWRKNGNEKGNAIEGNGNEKGKQCAGPSTNKGQNSKFDGCFICKGPHMARDCPRIEKLSALFEEEKSEDEQNEEDHVQATAYLGPMVVLKNAEATSSRTTNSSGGGGLLTP
ncbi:uncharacterized protein [Nicotiana sylvestris]|uniref:uncharacterized protein n=1 Tax=Nicotiana sylvestris TaxID=4096 RepID=UPI00388C4E91